MRTFCPLIKFWEFCSLIKIDQQFIYFTSLLLKEGKLCVLEQPSERIAYVLGHLISLVDRQTGALSPKSVRADVPTVVKKLGSWHQSLMFHVFYMVQQ